MQGCHGQGKCLDFFLWVGGGGGGGEKGNCGWSEKFGKTEKFREKLGA